ncbi:hypothetical protein P4361_08115 [Fictibacillus sp. B-59209]|nr:hypothetical protein [Fictibacillus sp. B-59209]
MNRLYPTSVGDPDENTFLVFAGGIETTSRIWFMELDVSISESLDEVI